MTDKKSQLTFLVSINDTAMDGNLSYRNSIGLEPVPYFCTKFNLQNAVVYLSQELQGMGFNCNFIDAASQKLNIVSLVNCLWEITQMYRSSVSESTTLLDQRRKDATDIGHFQSHVKDLRASVEEKERHVCDAQERERQAVSINKALGSKVKAEKEEVRRLNSVLQQREGHHQHELRKKETENNRLRERLHRLVSGERLSESRPAGITVSNPLTRSSRSRAMWKTEASGVRHEEEMHRKVLSQYEAWVGQLSDENDQIKGCLSAVTSHISTIVNKFAKSENCLNVDGEMNASMYSSDSLENPLFNLEFPAVREQVQQTLDEYLKVIVQLIEEKSGNDDFEKDHLLLKREVQDLQIELARTKDKLVMCRLSEENGESPEKETSVKFADDGLYVEEFAVLGKKEEELEGERKALQHERETFSEAAIRLNREKVAFEAEKVELLKRQFLKELPPTLSTSVDMTISGHESACSLSCGSLAELLMDSPQRNLGIPAITPPRANINLTRNSTPVVLGPTRLPRQQRDMYSETSAPKSLYRLKSAPVSRASSIPRQEEAEGQAVLDKEPGIRPYHSRPNTLERRRKPNSSSAALRLRSQSQSRVDVTKLDELRGRGELSYVPSRVEGETLLHYKRTDSQDMRYPFGRDSLDPFPTVYRDPILRPKVNSRINNASKRLTIPQSTCEDRYFQRDLFNHDDVNDFKDTIDDNTNLKTLEKDLLNLITKIGQHHGETASVSADEPPPYEAVTPKMYDKTNLSGLVSAPRSRSSSRRSSRDLTSTDDPSRRIHRRLVRK